MNLYIETVSMETLMPFYKPDEILGYCQNCPKYGQFWSCPPHEFDVPKYLNQFSFAAVIGLKVNLDSGLDQEAALDYYHERRRLFNQAIMQLECCMENVTVLYSGNCQECSSCCRKNGQACIHSERMRYSWESLGFKVSDIMGEILHQKLQWGKGIMPEHLCSVAGVLSKTGLKGAELMQLLHPHSGE